MGKRSHRLFGLSVVVSVGATAALLAGCQTQGAVALDRARATGAAILEVEGDPYDHVLLWRPGEAPRGFLSVYLEGDGNPARIARRRPIDATPQRTIALELWALDPGPALYLGRPGHLGAPAPFAAWSSGRYGEPVVQSLIAALRRSGLDRGDRPIALIGFSGGAALAALMAERMSEVRALVSIGGNLDVAAWTRHRDEPPLRDSVDPATRPALRPEIIQIHLIGERDEQVPPQLARTFLDRQPDPRVQRYEGFDHACCWTSVWPDVLAELRRELSVP